MALYDENLLKSEQAKIEECYAKIGEQYYAAHKDDDNAEFQLFRDDQLIYTSKAGDPTNYWDASGNANSNYRVDTLVNGTVVSSDGCHFSSGSNYFDIPLDVPKGGTINGEAYSYSPNDCCVGDVDGDGQYEIFLKWDPSNSKDNSQGGYTGNVYIDCYTDGCCGL